MGSSSSSGASFWLELPDRSPWIDSELGSKSSRVDTRAIQKLFCLRSEEFPVPFRTMQLFELNQGFHHQVQNQPPSLAQHVLM